MEPYNYSIGDIGSSFDASLKGYQTGLSLQDNQLKRDDADRARQLQIQMQGDLNAFSKLPNPSAQDFSRLMTLYPQLSEHFKRNFDVLNTGQQQDALSHATQVYSALRANQPEVADSLLVQREQAQRNSGNVNEANATKAQRELLKLNPSMATNTAGLFLSSALGPDKFAAAFPAISGEQRAQELQPSVVSKSVSEAGKSQEELTRSRMQTFVEPSLLESKQREARAGAIDKEAVAGGAPDRVRLGNVKTAGEIEEIAAKVGEIKAKYGDLPEPIEKAVSTALTDANMKTNQGRRASDLASRIQTLASQGGLATRGWNATLTALGMQGDAQALRQEYARLRNQNIMATLPPAFNTNFSNTDRQFVEAGIPDENANPEYIANFLRATSKVLNAEAANSRAMGEWQAANRGVGNAKRDMIVDGIPVARGSSYLDFTQTYVKQKGDEYQAQNSLREAKEQGRGYLRYGTQQPSRGAAGEF